MKKILIFALVCTIGIAGAYAAVRDGNTVSRAVGTQKNKTVQRVVTTQKSDATTPRTTVLAPARAVRATTARAANTPRAAQSVTQSRTAAKVSRETTPHTVIARASVDQTDSVISDTRTGAEYEKCKTTYFTCMDQFCQLKNDDYRRCSCSDRVYSLADTRKVLQEAGEQLTVFTENLDVVGMTASQASAMKNASAGEIALVNDSSASKALLQAIMNSIRGGDTNVGGRFSDLNSINISFDTTNAFGTADAGQIIATYNGQNLYNAVYPQCRNAVRADCSDAALQRAITAYLMAVEQDCNTVQTAIVNKQKEMKAALREGSAMLDLARVENRQKHNSYDFTACLNAVESAILSEEVCGSGYHRCLDNGEFIDVTTGKPIAGVIKFYELENLLSFSDGVDASHQKLAKISNNRTFVQAFEARVKKFAAPALDKCVEQADDVWAEYLDKAMLDIYYAQKAKVNSIKQGCFDFVSSCYVNSDKNLTDAMRELMQGSDISVKPDIIVLNSQLCDDYVQSCNNMFDGNIVADYINKRQDTDVTAACRAVAKQCFSKFGGANYENFYYPNSGLFDVGAALDWFTYRRCDNAKCENPVTVSECAKQLEQIPSCSDPKMIKRVFGGFDTYLVITQQTTGNKFEINVSEGKMKYGTKKSNDGNDTEFLHHMPRSTGVATEVYNQIVDILSTQCSNLQGRFLELQFIDSSYGAVEVSTGRQTDLCLAKFSSSPSYNGFVADWVIFENENMCPRNYVLNVDTESWGACLCWENGGRRSKNGQSAKCVAALPSDYPVADRTCGEKVTLVEPDPNDKTKTIEALVADRDAALLPQTDVNYWCSPKLSSSYQVCGRGTDKKGQAVNTDGTCYGDNNHLLPKAVTK